ncbi:MAG: DUF4157 domain-containing protein, partial [Gemmatimonadales bacterium]
MPSLAAQKQNRQRATSHAMKGDSERDTVPGRGAGVLEGLPLFLAGSASHGVQPKLTISPPDDPFESEADAVARAAVAGERGGRRAAAQAANTVQRKCASCESGGTSCSECAEEDERRGAVQRLPEPAATPPRPTGSTLLPQTPAAPLAPKVRERVEPVLGMSLKDVRVHSDGAAHDAAKS